MKRNLSAVIAPVAVVALAIAGAFSTHAMEKKRAAFDPLQGYRHISVSEPCRAVDMCSFTEGEICTVSGNQLFGKTSETSPCTVVLFKP